MPRLLLRTPSRLHFGLLSWDSKAPRQFGGVGLMIDAPGLTLSAQPSESWEAKGPLASRVLEFARRSAESLTSHGLTLKPASIEVDRSPPEHAGLGVGTQLGLGVARLLCELASFRHPSIEDLARLSGRGLRSGIGLHGFVSGGLIVDGGRSKPDGIPPLLARLDFPSDWSVLVIIPRKEPGLHGLRETQAFASLPPSSALLTDSLCRQVLLGLLPAVIEHDLPRFGEALEEIQLQVGEGFASVQGGRFARPDSEMIVGALKSEGLHGIGQSSWGPTLYAFSDASAEARQATLERLNGRLGLDPGAAFWTQASATGASLTLESETEPGFSSSPTANES